MARALLAWAINQRQKYSVRNLLYGPRTQLVYMNNRVVHVTIIRILFTLEKLHSETVFRQKLKYLPLYLHLNKHFHCSFVFIIVTFFI